MALQVLGRLRRALVVRRAVAEQLDRPDPDHRAIERERRAGAARDRDQPAPVRIAAVNRRLDQRRVGDRPRRPLRVGSDARAADATVISLVAPSPPRTMPIASGSQAAAQRVDQQPQIASARATTPLAPLASANTQSLVEHSPSTVIALKVSSTAARSARCSSAGATAASVVTKPSIVAIIGSIMPEPLAMPPTRNVPFAADDFDRRFLRKRIGRHDRRAPRRRRPSATARAAAMVMPRSTLSMSSFTPMTPVDATSTVDGSHAERGGRQVGHRVGVGHARPRRCRRWRSRC